MNILRIKLKIKPQVFNIRAHDLKTHSKSVSTNRSLKDSYNIENDLSVDLNHSISLTTRQLSQNKVILQTFLDDNNDDIVNKYQTILDEYLTYREAEDL